MNEPFPTTKEDFADQMETDLQTDLVLVYQAKSVQNDKIKARDVFEQNLKNSGLVLQHESGKDIAKEDDVVFVKIHAPADVLIKHADLLGLKKQVKLPKNLKFRAKTKKTPNFMKPHLNSDGTPQTLRVTFREEFVELFGDEDKLFSPAERADIVWDLLRRTPYGDKEEEIGIRRLINRDCYTAAYPLHDGPYLLNATSGTNDRSELFREWARLKVWYKVQPLDKIRDYFGDEVALYFAWLGFYTKMLIPASIVGLICFIYGLATMDNQQINTPSFEMCNKTGVGGQYLCPDCLNGACSYQLLADSCLYARLNHVFDNTSTVLFATFMSFWATMFLELWKRKQARLVQKWGLTDAQMDMETRPEFAASVQTTRPNKFTGQPEPYIPFWNKVVRVFTTISGVAFMLAVVVSAIIGVIVYELAIVAAFYDSGDDFLKQNTQILTSMTAALINLIVIMILTIVYKRIAKFLTDLECPRTQSDYEESFTFKIFVFEFVNCYSSLFYIAFFKGKFYTYPGDDNMWNSFLGIGADTCDPAGCISELFIQLIVIMVGKQFFNNFMEIAVPYIRKWLASDEKKVLFQKSPQWERDYTLEAPQDHSMSLFEEFMEMILQFGFTTLFVASFPLAPMFALLNNFLEIRLDAYKILCKFQRPVPKRTASLGAWFTILQTLTYIAVVTNAIVIAFTSEFIPRLVYWWTKSNNGLEGYVQYTLSIFLIDNYDAAVERPPGLTECVYNGFRYPPSDPNEYEVTMEHWHVLAARLAFIVIFEHLVFGISGLIAAAIPDLPWDVKEREYLEEKLVNKETEKYRKKKTRSMSPSTEALISHEDKNFGSTTVLV
ncbi:anoctamin-3-like isoform X2 [Neocloeon triangulifer]|uniref:anoctamin-3-like isoform X2 n=1 Tax=Neocloeon triangulifer TaxID=2078957 RepID=UPI00286FADB9|nr:anoctamin-3-like isoform X2 [Neocloeon triangulifer]